MLLVIRRSPVGVETEEGFQFVSATANPDNDKPFMAFGRVDSRERKA